MTLFEEIKKAVATYDKNPALMSKARAVELLERCLVLSTGRVRKPVKYACCVETSCLCFSQYPGRKNPVVRKTNCTQHKTIKTMMRCSHKILSGSTA